MSTIYHHFRYSLPQKNSIVTSKYITHISFLGGKNYLKQSKLKIRLFSSGTKVLLHSTN